jgi:hypothetical protein
MISQKHKNIKTQKHKNTKTQKHKNTKTQKLSCQNIQKKRKILKIKYRIKKNKTGKRLKQSGNKQIMRYEGGSSIEDYNNLINNWYDYDNELNKNIDKIKFYYDNQNIVQVLKPDREFHETNHYPILSNYPFERVYIDTMYLSQNNSTLAFVNIMDLYSKFAYSHVFVIGGNTQNIKSSQSKQTFKEFIEIIKNFGNEIKQQTISVNNPLRYKNVDFYQSDWNLLGIRVHNGIQNKTYEIPLFSLKNNGKAWITWLETSKTTYSLIFNQLQNTFLVFDQSGNFLSFQSIGDSFNENLILEILPSTGLLIKYDPSIQIIYAGFALLMITSSLSFLPYTQIWIFYQAQNSWLGCLTNRGKIQLEIEFENLVRYLENLIQKSRFRFPNL